MSSLKVYGAAMAKHLAKLSKFGGQFRLTLPKLLIDEIEWHDVEYVILYKLETSEIRIRRFVDGESLRTERKEDRPGSD